MNNCAKTFRKDPRGVAKATDRMRAAYRQYTEKTATVAELAKLYGVSANLVRNWFTKVREADEDARVLALAERE